MADNENEYVRIFVGDNAELYFQRKDGNHKVVATSEGYETPGGALKGAANAFKDIQEFILDRGPNEPEVIVARADAEAGRIHAAE